MSRGMSRGMGGHIPLHAPYSSDGVTAGGHRLVRPSPSRPLQSEGLSRLRLAQRQHAPADFGHRERDAHGRGGGRPPF
jgi:hypothetical protein